MPQGNHPNPDVTEEPPPEGAGTQGFSAVQRLDHSGVNLMGGGQDLPLCLGIPQHSKATVFMYLYDPVENVLPVGALVQNDVSGFQGRIRLADINRIPVMQKGDHAASGHGNSDPIMPLVKKLADHVQIFLCIHGFYHCYTPFHSFIILAGQGFVKVTWF